MTRSRPPWEDSYCEFFRARQRRFMRTSYAILGSWPAAEDATQQTFTQLYVHWPRIQRGALDTYARRVLVNTCLRQQTRRRREVVVGDVPDRPAVAADPGDRLDLAAALDGLSVTDRAVLALRFLDDLPVTEVAAVLRMPEGTVKSRTSRALMRLQAALTDQEISHD